MNSIQQELSFRQRMMEYLEGHGVIETANRYRVSRKTVWKYSKRWNGTKESLADLSRRPHNSPSAQSEEEKQLVENLAKKYGKDLIQAYQKAKEKGYTRSYGCFKRTAREFRKEKSQKKKRTNKPYERASYPGQKVQVDVKFVPTECVVGDKKYYVYCAKDECTRWTYRQMYDEHSTYSSACFLEELIRRAPFPIRMIQTDNGSEFTKALTMQKHSQMTLFEEKLMEYGILYHRIRLATPRHNGKVERGNRTDGLRFYSKLKMFSLEDGRKQLAVYQRKSNNIIMSCLGMSTPNQVVEKYAAVL